MTNTTEYQRNYRAANKERLQAQQKAYREANRTKMKLYVHNRVKKQRRNQEPSHMSATQLPMPDRLLETLHIKLTNEQEAYLQANMKMSRPQLFKQFRSHFNSNINKLQFNFALEKVSCKYGQKLA